LASNVYEGMFILDSNRYARDPEGTVAKIVQTVEQHGGEMLVSRLWNEQKLAYQIKGHRKGTYWLTYFRVEGESLSELNHQTTLNNDVLRYLFLKVDPRLVDALVAHASGVSIEEEPTNEEATGEEEPVAVEATADATDEAVADGEVNTEEAPAS